MTSHKQLSPELLLERQSSLNVLRDLPDILHSMEKYDSLSEYFIHNLITDGKDKFDFSMEDVFRLCDLEPQHCQEVFMALEYKTATEKSSSNFIKKPVRFPDQLAGYKAMLGSDSDDVSGDIIFSEKDHNDREEGGDVQYNQIISDSVTKQSSQVQIPKYLFLVGLLPFFPLILLFAGSSALSFVLTTSIEFVLSQILPKPREVTFGKLWIGLTFVLFVPMLGATIQIVTDFLT